MERYIGLDVHSQTCTMAVVGASGRRLRSMVLETNAKVLIDALRSIAGSRRLCMEEGAQSEWLYEIMEPHLDELVVIQPKDRVGSKNDSIDSWDLAETMRARSWKKRVIKSPHRFSMLREAVRSYDVATRDVARAKNRLRAVFRARGIQVNEAIYEPKSREAMLKQLKRPQRLRTECLAAQLDALLPVKERAEAWLLEEVEKVPEIKIVQSAPGIGPVRAARIVAIVVTPDRFRKKQQFWSYCGLGIVTRSSADWEKDSKQTFRRRKNALPRGLNRNRNPHLKNVFKSAAKHVLTMRKHPLCICYEQMLKNKIEPHLAHLTIARRIASAVLAIWKRKEEYDPAKHRAIAS
jgi:transposase